MATAPEGALATVRAYAPDLGRARRDVATNGFELQARIRADGKRVSALFLTARDAVEDRVGGLTLGADGGDV